MRAAVFFLLLVCCSAAPAQVRQPDLNLENYTYPFPVSQIRLNAQHQELRMSYMDALPAKPNGTTVVLLHGKNFNGAYWKQTANALLSQGFRVIMPDQAGFGKSSKPQHFQYSFAQLAENTKLLLDSLHVGKAVIVGHSMGGMLAIRFALQYPERVKALVLEDPIGLEDYAQKVPHRSVNDWYAKELKQTRETMKQYQQESYYAGEWKPEYDEWLDMTADWTLSKDYPLIAWNSALCYDMILTQPVIYELERISMPTLLIAGEKDRTAIGKDLVPEDVKKTMGDYPTLAKDAKRRIPRCSLVMLQGTGHVPHIQSFDAFIQPLTEFLSR